MLHSSRPARTSRAVTALIAAGVIAGSLATWAEPSAAAKRSAPTGATTSSYTVTRTYTQQDDPVEQQSPGWPTNPDHSEWVHNPTPCAWDVDDTFVNWSVPDAVLGAGEVATHTECILADWQTHLTGVSVVASSPDLKVSFSYTEGAVFQATPRLLPDGRTEYRACVVGPIYVSNDPAIVEIPDSNGGVAARSSVTLRVENPTGRRITKAITKFQIGWANDSRTEFCPGPMQRVGMFDVGTA